MSQPAHSALEPLPFELVFEDGEPIETVFPEDDVEPPGEDVVRDEDGEADADAASFFNQRHDYPSARSFPETDISAIPGYRRMRVPRARRRSSAPGSSSAT